MIFIAQRIQARLPVLVMGETGCGKTSLIKFLVAFMNVKFDCLNVHAGITEQNIQEFVDRCIDATENNQKPVWAFLDEINTCEHLGLIADLLCHRQAHRELPNKLVFLAACNPYRLQQGVSRNLSLDLDGARGKLVYTVHELPEALLEHLQDFGALGKEEERSYIRCMVKRAFEKDDKKIKDEYLESNPYYCTNLFT